MYKKANMKPITLYADFKNWLDVAEALTNTLYYI